MKNLNRCLIVVLLIALIYILNYYQDTMNKKNKKDNTETENFKNVNDNSNMSKGDIKNNDMILYDKNIKNHKNIKNDMKNDIKKNMKKNNYEISSNGDSLDGISQLELDTFNNSLGSSFVPSIFDESE